jgi:hypothetical protein
VLCTVSVFFQIKSIPKMTIKIGGASAGGSQTTAVHQPPKTASEVPTQAPLKL